MDTGGPGRIKPPSTNPPRITQAEFLGTIWGGVGVSFIFLAIRVFSRFRGYRRLWWDDGLVIFAWLLALLSAICWQVVADFLYSFLNVASGSLSPPPENFTTDTEKYYTSQLIVLIFFYTSLYCVKLSFLFFFKRLGHNVKGQGYIWWPVLFFTLATYFVCIGDIQYKCIVGSFEEIIAVCGTDENIKYTLNTLKANCALDVLSDFLIMIIPFTILWNVQMRWKKKFALMGIFSLVIITMVFAIVRVALVSTGSQQPDVTWLYLWTSIEQCIAIIVCALSAFPRLFAQSAASDSEKGFNPSDTYKSMMRRIRNGERRRELSEMSILRTNGSANNVGDVQSQKSLDPPSSAGHEVAKIESVPSDRYPG